VTIAKIIRGLIWADVFFIWFAGPHAYWTIRFINKFPVRSIVVVGGNEVAKVEEIEYGSVLDTDKAKKVRFVLRSADRILTVSECNNSEIIACDKDLKPVTVYNGVDVGKFSPENDEKKRCVLTVGYIDRSTLKKKWLDTFVKAAKYLQDIDFYLVGKCTDDSIDQLRSFATENVHFIGFITDDELLELYRQTKVYCQLSRHESFGVALAEAMSCECVPVVTKNGALLEVVGDIGFFVPYDDPQTTAKVIIKAMDSNNGRKARDRIVNVFDIKIRKEKISRIIDEMMGE